MEPNQHRQSMDPIAQLSHELNVVLTMNQDVCQEAESLYKELAIYEARLEYVDAALAESQRIAGDITSDAEQRVGKIVYNAQKVVMPHQEVIAALNLEIAQLAEKLEIREASRQEKTPPPVAEEKLADQPGEVIEQLTVQVAETMEIEPAEVIVPDRPAVKRQYSLREPQEFDEEKADQSALPVDDSQALPPLRWQYSMSNYQFSAGKGQMPAGQPAAEGSGIAKRQYSLREPQDFAAEVEVEAVKAENTEIPAMVPEPETRMQYSMIRPQSLASPEPIQETHTVAYEERFEIDFANGDSESADAESFDVVSELASEILAPESIPPVVLSESHFDLDVTLTLCYYDVDDQARRSLIKPTWQAKVVVEVPRENETASYGKAFSAVTSTLYRYDDVILNDVYPFDLLSPGTKNIGMYFYNCLEDCLTFMDLNLLTISLWDGEELVIKVDERNQEFDRILLKGEDILEDIRSKVLKRQNSLVKDPSRGRLGSLFKN